MALRAEAQPRSAPRPASARPELRVVPGRGRRWYPVPVVVLIILAAFGVTALQAWLGEEGLRRAALEQQVQEETERLTLLRAKVAQLSSPQRIADEATGLGMVPMGNPVQVEASVVAPTPAPEAFDPEAIKRLTSPTP